MYNYYSQGVFNGTYPNSIIYLSGWSDSGPDKLTYGGGDGSMLSNGKGGRGGIRIVWGFDRSFPSTNVSTV
jgi:hypothetical protein